MTSTPTCIAVLAADLNMAGSAGDDKVVDHVVDTADHPGGVYYRVVLSPGVDVPGQCHRVAIGADLDVAVIRDQRVAVQRVLHQYGDIARVGGEVDHDLVLDVADAGQPADCEFGRGSLGAE